VAVEISLKAERQHNDAIMKQLADTQVEIVELQRNLEDADRRNSVLRDSLERFFSYLNLLLNIISSQNNSQYSAK
jgi:septal ring factor EnvC (AmiA/AmiB activator)